MTEAAEARKSYTYMLFQFISLLKQIERSFLVAIVLTALAKTVAIEKVNSNNPISFLYHFLSL